MRWFVAYFLTVAVLPAQDATQQITGDLLEWDAGGAKPAFSIRQTDHRVIRCAFDSSTQFERNGVSALPGARPGDVIEAAVRGTPGYADCFAQYIKVSDPPVAHRRAVRPRVNLRAAQPARPSLDWMFPRGNLTFAGVITQIHPDTVVLRTRQDGPKTFTLRQDTRYLSGGLPAEASSLLVNTKVFIRAGKNFDNQLEAFQIVWGEVLHPQ